MKQKNLPIKPYIYSILLGLLCTFMTGLGVAISQIMELEIDLQLIIMTVVIMISIMIGVFIMKKSPFAYSEYGFCKSKKDDNKTVWWYIPLVVIEILPIAIVGFSSDVPLLRYVILIFFTIAVGINEEIYFRGMTLKILEGVGKKKAIIWSSIIFGILHLANAFNNKDILYLILQMVFAFLVGFVLAEIVSITKSLWIVIIWHAAHDYIASVTSDVLDYRGLMILAIQVGVLLIYAIGIWKKSTLEIKETT